MVVGKKTTDGWKEIATGNLYYSHSYLCKFVSPLPRIDRGI